LKRERAVLVERDYPGLSVRRQCELLDAPRSSVYYRKRERAAKPGSPSDTEICRMIDEIVMIDPTAGSRRTTDVLRIHFGVGINRKRVIRLRRQMGNQGSQFTSEEWTGGLKGLGIRISMDGRRRWLDNVFIERLWRSLKYEDVYVREYADVMALEEGIGHWFERYNTWRPHQSLGKRLPALMHRPGQPMHWVNPRGKAA